VDLIKMDIIGADYAALKGAEPLIVKYKPKIIIKATLGGESWAEILELLNGHAYRSYRFDEGGKLIPGQAINGDHPNVVFLPG